MEVSLYKSLIIAKSFKTNETVITTTLKQQDGIIDNVGVTGSYVFKGFERNISGIIPRMIVSVNDTDVMVHYSEVELIDHMLVSAFAKKFHLSIKGRPTKLGYQKYGKNRRIIYT